MALIDKVKTACRVTNSAYNDELTDLIAAAFADLGITDIRSDVLTEQNISPLVQRAVITYCKLNFGFAQLEENQYNRLKSSYDEQKAQMSMNSAYTTWEAE